MNKAIRLLIAALLLGLAAAAGADQLLMIRSSQPFPETMSALQNAISDWGYKVTRVQNVDIGLSKIGYKTDNYKVVFYGKAEEVAQLVEKHPELIPYLPLNIVIFAEGDDSIVLTTNPRQLGNFFDKPELQKIFSRWEQDTRAVFDALSKAP